MSIELHSIQFTHNNKSLKLHVTVSTENGELESMRVTYGVIEVEAPFTKAEATTSRQLAAVRLAENAIKDLEWSDDAVIE